MARKTSKRTLGLREQFSAEHPCDLLDALRKAKESATAKFDESVDIAVNLGIDARKSEQAVRGAFVLPHGIGKSVRVAVFAEGQSAADATEAGADIVGQEDLMEKMSGGDLNYDVVIATPSSMPMLSKLGKLLGPKGLMPNPKTGTVTTDTAQAVKNAKAGQVRYRTDKNGLVHCTVGRASFQLEALQDNTLALLQELKRAKPAAAKGSYFRKLSVSSTMGPGFAVDPSSLDT